MRTPILAAAGLVAVAAFVVWRRSQVEGQGAALWESSDLGTDYGTDYDSAGGGDWLADLGDSVKATVSTITARLTGYSPAKVPEQYRGAIAQAEAANGIPSGLLARLLWQESRYRADIISGATRSPVGAVGIAQFMPATAAEWGVNPLDPFQSIDGAGRYLAWLYRRLGGWAEALAAYNWGIGNVQRKGLAAAPAETRTYYASILQDVGLA